MTLDPSLREYENQSQWDMIDKKGVSVPEDGNWLAACRSSPPVDFLAHLA